MVDAICLERAFEEGGVFEVVKGVNSDRALGPDGFTIAFFQTCWDVLKEDIITVFHDFHTRGKFERSLNAMFITHILNRSWVFDIKDF